MVKILIIKKNTDIKVLNAKNLTKETIYKKCGLTSSKNFKKQHTWKIGEIYYSVFAKDKGKAGSENKYEFPPPIDEKLFFGSLAVIKHDDVEMYSIKDLTEEVFNNIVEKLLGGFHDLNEEETESEEEKIPDEYKSKQGYSKEDGFVVSDDDVEFDDLNDSDYDESEEYVEQVDDEDDEDSFEYEEDEEEEVEGDYGDGDGDGDEDEEDDEEEDEEDSDEYEEESDLDEEEYLTEESYISSDDD